MRVRPLRQASGKNRIYTTLVALVCIVQTISFIFPAAPVEAVFGDDYPWKSAYEFNKSAYDWRVDENQNGSYNDSGEGLSPLGFGYRNCTDYAAWRLNVAMGGSETSIKFSYALGSMRGDAAQWKDYTVSTYGASYVNDTPAEGAVAWWGATTTNTAGHVGIVGQITDADNIIIEDYNKGGDGTYQKRAVSRSNGWPQKFLHIADTPSKLMPEPAGPGLPIGDLEAYRAPGGIRVKGWTLDPDTSDSIRTHIYAGNGEAKSSNPAIALTANLDRPDVARAYPGYGSNHGFSGILPLGAGTHRVCAYGINTGQGYNRRYDCVDITIATDPFGAFDSIRREPGGVRVTGWAIDPDTGKPIAVHFYGGTGAAGAGNPGFARTASSDRPDVARVYPDYGSTHGFNTVLALKPGNHTVCAYAINASGTLGSNRRISCRGISVSADPFGAFDSIKAEANGVRVKGWAIDPDTKESIAVHFYGGTGAAGSPNPGFARMANSTRTDVARVYPGYDELHGYDTLLALKQGTHKVCAYAINFSATPGSNKLISCKSITF